MKFKFIFLSFLIITFWSCGTNPVTPTPVTPITPVDTLKIREKMLGNWEMTDAFLIDSSQNIKSTITNLTNAIQLTDDNGMVCTCGPMATYLVFGNSNWSNITNLIPNVFRYNNLEFNTGEWFTDTLDTTTFDILFKLKSTSFGTNEVNLYQDMLRNLGVQETHITRLVDNTLYLSFQNIKVSFTNNYETMTWEINSNSNPVYQYKDFQGNLNLWIGYPVNNYIKSKYVWSKKTLSLSDIVSAYI